MMLSQGGKKLAVALAHVGVRAKRHWVNRDLTVGQSFNNRPEEAMDFFTTLDIELDSFIVNEIRAEFSIDRFLTEEGATLAERNAVGGKRAVIDSLDGSSNFATYRPDFGISIAIENNGSPILAGVITPARGELLLAEKDRGTHLISWYEKGMGEVLDMIEQETSVKKVSFQSFALKNKKRLASPLQTSRVYVHTGKRRNFELSPDDKWNTIYSKLANPACSFCCSVALVEVALGKLDGAAIAYQNHWDYAAGRLLVEEAGGCFEAWDRSWNKQLTDKDLAEAHATKDENKNEWLCHILAAGTPELLAALRSHFVS